MFTFCLNSDLSSRFCAHILSLFYSLVIIIIFCVSVLSHSKGKRAYHQREWLWFVILCDYRKRISVQHLNPAVWRAVKATVLLCTPNVSLTTHTHTCVCCAIRNAVFHVTTACPVNVCGRTRSECVEILAAKIMVCMWPLLAGIFPSEGEII